MAALSSEELLRLWRQEALSVEMAIGHTLQNLVKLQSDLDAQRQLLQATLEAQRQALAGIQANLPPLAHTPPAKSKRRKPNKTTARPHCANALAPLLSCQVQYRQHR